MSENFPYRYNLLQSLIESKSESDHLESKLQRWSEPPSQSELEKCERAVRMVREAIADDPTLNRMDIEVFAKGSFYNRTNIRSDSDVDVGVKLKTLYYNIYPIGLDKSYFGFSDATYDLNHFKQALAKAIQNKFGAANITVGDKAIRVHANTARVDADVVAHAVHRYYRSDKSFLEGVSLITTEGRVIYNWPAQDYQSGIDKNARTSKNYKAMVRILKSLRAEMIENEIASAKNVAPYLLACLVWNIPDYFFNDDTFTQKTEQFLHFLRESTSDMENVKEWVEVNQMKYLFRVGQPWKIEEVHFFLSEAFEYFEGQK